MKKTLYALAALVAVPMFGAGSSMAAETLILGYSMAKTGPFVSLSRSNEIAADMAVEEINKAGGVNGKKLVVKKFDTSGDPKQAVVAVRRFAQDENALAVIGPFSSGEAGVAFPAGERLGIVQMPMASSAPGLAKKWKYGFRNTTNELIMFSRVIATLKAKGYPTATAAIAYGTDDRISKVMGSKVLPAVMKKMGIKVTQFVTFKIKGTFDVSAQVTQLAQNPTDLVGVGAPPEQAILLVKEMRKRGHKGRLVAGSTINDPLLPERMGTAGNGTTIPTTFFADLNDQTRSFTKKFMARSKAAGAKRLQPNQFDASTYDIVYIFAEAMKKAGVTGDKDKVKAERTAIRDQLNAMKGFPALEGAISFGADGDALKPVYVIEIRDGKWELLEAHPADG